MTNEMVLHAPIIVCIYALCLVVTYAWDFTPLPFLSKYNLKWCQPDGKLGNIYLLPFTFLHCVWRRLVLNRNCVATIISMQSALWPKNLSAASMGMHRIPNPRFQKISVDVKHGNAASIMATIPSSQDWLSTQKADVLARLKWNSEAL